MSDHSQLTAYLLGELVPEDAAQVETQLAASAELRQELDALRQTVSSLEAALASQSPPEVPAIERDKLHLLLRSAVVVRHEPMVSAPVLLTEVTGSPLRRGSGLAWLTAASALVVGGVVGLSQWGADSSRTLALREHEQLNRGTTPLLLATRDTSEGSSPNSVNYERQRSKVSGANSSAWEERTLDLAQPVLADQVQQPSHVQMEKQLDAQYMAIDETVQLGVSAPVDVRNNAYESRSTLNFQEGGARLPDGDSSTDRFVAGALMMPESGFAISSFSSTLAPSDNYQMGRTLSRQSGLAADRLSEPMDTMSLTDQVVLEGELAENRISLGRGIVDQRGRGGDFGVHFQFDIDSNSTNQTARHWWAYRDNSQRGELFGSDRVRFGDDFTLSDTGLGGRAGQQSGVVSESAPYADSNSFFSRIDVAEASRPSLTVADYENGLARLGQAVQNWDVFSHQWDENGKTATSAHGGQGVESTEGQAAESDSIQSLSRIVSDQTRTLHELREKNPEIVDQPLIDANPEAVKETELALLRVSRELARQQQIWYYREGYVRQLEATIAAAEQYAHVPENDFVTPVSQPLSTFGIDVDTASYSNVRRFVEAGQLPPPDAVRIEELVNSFQYEGPKVEGDAPLAVAAEVSVCPWQPQHRLLRVALKGKSIDLQQRPPARLVFLIDTSGSMSDENKLPLVKQSLRILVDQMREQDRLSIVTYSDNAGLLLDSTGGDKREAILAAIEGLAADGSTNGEAGLKLAYEVAVKQFGDGATNRVMLCTDGDFNVGESADSELVKLIEKQRQTGVFLNIFGFGSGNLKDAKLEAIADKGNGQYIYIDGVKEARKTLLNELTGTLYTIAKDVKLQVEFNPNLVGSYRLVGYENRAMAAQDFSNDKVDSGDMGAGHSVVALYEIVPPGAPQPVAPQPEVEPLKYQRAKAVGQTILPAPSPDPAAKTSEASPDFESPVPPAATPPADPPAPAVDRVKVPVPPADPLASELCTIRVRYKQPTSNESTKIETVVADPSRERGAQLPVSRDSVWATAVAQFGLLARRSNFVGTGNYSQVLELAQSAIGEDPTGQRREFVTLVRQMQHLSFERERQIAELSRRAEEHRRVVEEVKTVEQAPDVMTKASCSGKYRTLLRRIEVADDQPAYGEFKDWGRWEGAEYKTHKNLPHGYWVYVAPHWYIWGESTEQAAVDANK